MHDLQRQHEADGMDFGVGGVRGQGLGLGVGGLGTKGVPCSKLINMQLRVANFEGTVVLIRTHFAFTC